MKIVQATLVPLQEPGSPWLLRLDVKVTGLPYGSAPLIASVGNVQVESILNHLEHDGFGGLLPSVPPSGSELHVGFLDIGLRATGIFLNPPPIV